MFGLCSLMRGACIACCIAATSGLAAATQDATTAPAIAQPAAPGSDESEAARLEAAAIDAYLAARAWLDAEQLPRPEDATAAVELPGVTAVAVLLRLDGRLVGAADDAGEPGLQVRRALGRALAKALGDETIRAVRAGVGDRVGARLSLEVEVAGALRPLLGRTIAEAAARVDRGREGIALRRGESVARAFPSRLAAVDGADRPDRTITALIGEAGLPARDLNEFGAEDRVSLARFATARMRADAAGSAPALLERGGRTIGPSEVTPAATRALAAQLAARLAAQVVARAPSGWVLLGTLQPAEDRYDPPIASARETAFAALALARLRDSDELPLPVRDRAAATHAQLLATLAALPTGERGPMVDALEALAAWRGAADASDGAAQALRTTLAASLRAHGPVAAKLDAETRGFLAAALARLDTDETRAQAATILDALLADAQSRPGMLVDSALPLAILARDGRLDEARLALVRAAIQEAARVAAAIQLRADAAPGGENAAMLGHGLDLEGGLLLPGPRGTIPTTQSLRLAAALAIAEPVLDPSKAPERAATIRHLVRFLAQHVAQDPWAGGFRNPDALRGLVRDSLDRDDCPPLATAAGALFAIEAASQKPPKP